MRGLIPYALRAVALVALVLLLWNPAVTRDAPAAGPPLVMLDASLSMADSTRWRAALDTARAAARGGVIWRFGARVTAFDTTPPTDGASRLAPALVAAAARAGPVVVVTDGEVDDAGTVPPDLLDRPRVTVLPRPAPYDAFVARVDGPQRVSAGDTLRLRVTYGAAGGPAPGGPRAARLVVSSEGRRLTAHPVSLPDSGVVIGDVTLPGFRLPGPGWSLLDVRLEGARDAEPRDDARLAVVDVSPEPAAVMLAAPPNWETRFLAVALEDVARVPLRVFVRLGGDAGAAWRDGRTLRPVLAGEVERALRRARLVVRSGPSAVPGGLAPGAAVLTLAGGAGREGEWYVRAPGPSPIAGALAGVAWETLPPATALAAAGLDTAAGVVALTVALARRGALEPAVVLREDAGRRRATVRMAGLWRWQLRGGESAVAYRALIAALVDWLLAGGAGEERDRVVPESRVAAQGLPLVWRWTGVGEAGELPVRLTSAAGERRDTLRFDAAGRAELWLPPGAYRYAVVGGPERGLVAVETYSDEWRPRPAMLAARPGAARGRRVAVGMRERWWLYVLALGALVGEWVWRRRQGLP